MKVTYDQESDILYLAMRPGPAYDSEEPDEDIRVEYDKKRRIVGIEVLDARKNIGKVMAQEIAQHVKTFAR